MLQLPRIIRRKPTPPALAWDRIDALLADKEAWRAVTTDAATRHTVSEVEAGSLNHSAEAWMFGLYYYEAHICALTDELAALNSPTADQSAVWCEGGAETHWTGYFLAYHSLIEARLQVNIHLAALGMIRIRERATIEVA